MLFFAVMSQFSPGKAVTHFLSAALGPRRTNMADTKSPFGEQYARHYPVVMECAGVTKGDNFERMFDRAIQTIFCSYWVARDQRTVAGYYEVLKKYAEGQAMVREALRSLRPIYSVIEFAARLHDIPEPKRDGAIELHLSMLAEIERLSWGRVAPSARGASVAQAHL
jgi:hypothetical protein